MIITPLQSPALFLLELKDTSSLRIDLEYVQNSRDVYES